jgi:hypothetical protein
MLAFNFRANFCNTLDFEDLEKILQKWGFFIGPAVILISGGRGKAVEVFKMTQPFQEDVRQNASLHDPKCDESDILPLLRPSHRSDGVLETWEEWNVRIME